MASNQLEAKIPVSDLDQVELEQIILVSILMAGTEGFKKLPMNIRPTVFLVGSHQEIFQLMERVVKETSELKLTSVTKYADEKLSGEIKYILDSASGRSDLVDGQLEEAALELIRRAESSIWIDTSKFHPMRSEELAEILGLTIKQDQENKLITFMAELSAFTEDSQLNISFNAPSSTGKSYIPTEIARLFPDEDLIEVGYCSPTGFFHDHGAFNKEKGGYIVDLSRKILIFLDQPHTLLLQHLRPLLSHDKKELRLKITDKNQKFGLKTKNIYLRGYPAVIFCTVGLKIDEQETTRFLLLSPETSQEKIREAINVKIKRETDAKGYEKWLDANPKRQMLKDRIRAIKQEQIHEIKIGSVDKINEAFFRKAKPLKPRHQRDIGRIIGLVKAFALLNLWFRDREPSTIISNEDDIREAFQLWDAISESQELNLPPYIYQLYNQVILPACNEKNAERGQYVTELKGQVGLTRREITSFHLNVYGRPLPDWTLRQQIIPMLEASGLIVQEADPDDKRKMIIYPTTLLTISDLKNGHNERI